VFTFAIVFITDDGKRHCGVLAHRGLRTGSFGLYEARREENLTRLENDVL